MNYYAAREMADATGRPTGRWHYTVRNDDRTYPVGNCAGGCPGHDSPEEAQEHQRQYDLAHARFDVTFGSYNPCEVCGELTNRGAQWGIGGMSQARLCDEHRTPEHLNSRVTVSDVMSSF